MAFHSIGHKHSDTVLKPWHPLLTHSVILPSSPRITITVSHHGKAPLIDNHPKTGLLYHSEVSGWCAINHLMKWCDWHEYPPSYDNYSYGNYRPCLLRLLQCQDFELSLPHAYTSARQLQLNNLQLNSTLWSAPRSIKPHGSHPYIATSKTCCYFRTTDTICLLRLLQKPRTYSLTKASKNILFIKSYL